MLFFDGPLQSSPLPSALAMTAMAANASCGALHPAFLAGRINTTAWPKVCASCHQSLLVLRIAARLWKELGRHRQSGVRKLRMALPFVCFRI